MQILNTVLIPELKNLKWITKINTTYKTTYKSLLPLPPTPVSLSLSSFHSFLVWKNEDSLAYINMISVVHGLKMSMFVFSCM